MTSPLNLFIRESLAIEGVELLQLSDAVRQNVIRAHERFFDEDPLTLASIVDFVRYVEPTAKLRTTPGMNVSVHGHNAMPGGEQVRDALLALVHQMNEDKRPRNVVSFDYYWRYLYLHPFTDCNGRSARAIWVKLRGGIGREGFLSEFHHNALTWQDAYRSVDDRPVSPNFYDADEAAKT